MKTSSIFVSFSNFRWISESFYSLRYKKCKAATTLSQTRLRSFSRRFEQSLNLTRSRCESLWAIWQDIKWTNMKDSFWENESSQRMIESIESDASKEIDWSTTLNWSCRVKYLSLSQVLNSSRLDSSQNSWLEYLSQVKMFNLSIQVESENWNQVST